MGPGSRRLYIFFLYLVISALVIYLDKKNFFNPLHGFVQNLTTPLESALFSTKNSLLAPFSVFSSVSQKDTRIKELEEENFRLLSQVSATKALEEENARSRHLLGSSLPPSWKFEPARVVSSFSGRLILAGTTELKSGTPVVFPKERGVYLGQVDKIRGREAEVILPTNQNSRITVLVRDRETKDRHGQGILVGKEKGLLLEQVLTSEIIEEGDLVVTSGDNTPAELLVGFVKKVLPAKGTFQEAEIEYPIDPKDLDFVFLVTKF